MWSWGRWSCRSEGRRMRRLTSAVGLVLLVARSVAADADPLPAGARLRLGTVRWRQPAVVTGLLFDRAGNELATVGDDGGVRLWHPDGRVRLTVTEPGLPAA